MTSIAVFLLIGRIIFGLYWLMAAYRHLFHSGPMVGYTASQGVKWPKTAVIGSGILLLIGGLSMLTGFAPKVGVIVLVIFLIGVSFKMHAYWKIQDPSMRMINKINFDKNMAMLGALLMILAISTPWVWSWGW